MIVIGDGIFDQLSNEQLAESVWNQTFEEVTKFKYRHRQVLSFDNRHPNKKPSFLVHTAVAEGVETSIKAAAAARSLDNLTVLILGFKGFKRTLKKLVHGKSF